MNFPRILPQPCPQAMKLERILGEALNEREMYETVKCERDALKMQVDKLTWNLNDAVIKQSDALDKAANYRVQRDRLAIALRAYVELPECALTVEHINEARAALESIK